MAIDPKLYDLMIGDEWARHSLDELKVQYDRWLSSILQEPPWSTSFADGDRIPWQSTREAMKIKKGFRFPGLYLWGTSQGIPRYVGKTTKTLSERITHRYVGNANSQCQLALRYETVLTEKGWKGLPDEIIAWYIAFSTKKFRSPEWKDRGVGELAMQARSGHGSVVRLEHAEDFAKHGIQGMWYALIPFSDPSQVTRLERDVIEIANRSNLEKGRPPLVND